MLINILILFFIFLISYQLILANRIIEGAQGYQKYEEDPLILGKQNAANIEVLKGQVDKLSYLPGKVDKLDDRVKTLEKQINEIAIQNKKQVDEITNVSPPN
jgi:TolA-binding protein